MTITAEDMHELAERFRRRAQSVRDAGVDGAATLERVGEEIENWALDLAQREIPAE